MSHLSVIVSDGSTSAQQVQELVADWARVGLLGESVWVCPGDVTATAGPPQVMSTVIGPDGSDRADLFHTIGVRRLDTVRVVVAQFIVTGDTQALELPELGRTLARLLVDVLPRSVSAETSQGTSLRLINVLIPASGISGVTRDVLLPGWDANAVVAAEDRPDLDRASVFVRAASNYSGHAAAAVASVAALWSGIDQGSLDILDTDSTTTETQVAVLRHAIRAIVRSNDVQELADLACAYVVNDPAAPAHIAEWARPALEPGSVVDSMFAAIMETGDWAVRKPDPDPDPEKTQRRFGASFRKAGAYNVRLFGSGFKAIAGACRRVVEKVVTGVLEGRHGDAVVRFHPSSSRSVVLSAQAVSDSQTAHLRTKMLKDEAGNVEAPNAATWVNLRRSCFGLVDGSQLPGEFEVSEIAGKPQILPPLSVVPDPADKFQTAGLEVIRACDAQAAAEYVRELRDAAGESALSSESDSRPAGLDTEGTGSDEALAGVPEKSAKTTEDPDSMDEDPALVDAERERAKEELVALEDWISTRRDTLVWRIFDRVVVQAAQNDAKAQRAFSDATATDLPPTETLKRSQRRLVLAWSILGLVFVAVLTYLWSWEYGRELITADDLTKRIAILVLAILLLGALFNHLYYLAVGKFARSVELLLASRRRTAGTYLVAQRETRRFQLLASRLNEWAEIIGSVLHYPYAPRPAGQVLTVSDQDVTHLPASVAVAVPPEQTAEISTVVMARAVQVLTPRGWASQAFEDAVETYASNVRTAYLGGHLAADLDTLNTPTSPLGRLWGYFLSGDAGMHATKAARERIEKALADGVLELPPRSVRRLGEYSGGDEMFSDGQFFGGVLHPAIPFVRDIWKPTGLMNHKNVPDDSAVWMPRAAGLTRPESLVFFPATGDVALRVDISRLCDIGDLEVFVLDVNMNRSMVDSASKDGGF